MAPTLEALWKGNAGQASAPCRNPPHRGEKLPDEGPGRGIADSDMPAASEKGKPPSSPAAFWVIIFKAAFLSIFEPSLIGVPGVLVETIALSIKWERRF